MIGYIFTAIFALMFTVCLFVVARIILKSEMDRGDKVNEHAESLIDDGLVPWEH